MTILNKNDKYGNRKDQVILEFDKDIPKKLLSSPKLITHNLLLSAIFMPNSCIDKISLI